MTTRILRKNQRLNRSLRRWIPQGARDLINRLTGHAIYYKGEYGSWEDARCYAAGYGEQQLLTRLTDAARKVRDGRAAWEQDGVTHDLIPSNMPVFGALARVALASNGHLSVLDFGGALGSTYLQCRNYLADAKRLNWSIVEQAALVSIGQKEFEGEGLKFFGSIAEATETQSPNVALLSSVLQYLEDPWSVIDGIISARIPYVIIDRHPCSVNREIITVQVVPPSLYYASYPSWLFDCTAMLARLKAHFDVIACWDGHDPPIRGWGIGAEFHGYFLRRNDLI